MEIKSLLATATLPALGPEVRPDALPAAGVNARLDALFRESKLSATRQELIRALLLLWHDQLDASHQISQNIENADGSFVHAIMHRREPDYWNAKYWWRRVGMHPAFPEIARRVNALLVGSQRLAETELAKRLVPSGRWDAGAFVDLCEEAASSQQQVSLLREIQHLETEVLLESLLAQ